MNTKFYYKTTKYLYPPEVTSESEASEYKHLIYSLNAEISRLRRNDSGGTTSPLYGPGAPGILPNGWPDEDKFVELETTMFTVGMKIVRIWHSQITAQHYVNLINGLNSPYIRAELAESTIESTEIPEEYRAY